MGVTQQLPEKDKYLYRRDYLLDRLAVIMGGRAAEEIIFDTATSGAENDLKQVRKMARKMVLDWGMGEKFKHISLGGDQGSVFLGEELAKGKDYSDETAREVDEEIQRITENAFQRAVDTLGENRDAFDRLADLLIEREEVPGTDVLRLVKEGVEALEEASTNGVSSDGEVHADGETVSSEPSADEDPDAVEDQQNGTPDDTTEAESKEESS
jgi:cell division protease FtsH